MMLYMITRLPLTVSFIIFGCSDNNVTDTKDNNVIVDKDSDGFGEDIDCDGLVDDLDNSIDDTTKTTFYFDYDADSFGDNTHTISSCTAPIGYVSIGGDCSDINSQIHPSATEICDGIDNNCDGTLDDLQTVSSVNGTIYTDQSSIFTGGTSTNPKLVDLLEDEYIFCGGTYYIQMEVTNDVTLSSISTPMSDTIFEAGNSNTILYSNNDNITIEISNITMQNSFNAIVMEGSDTTLLLDMVTIQNNTTLSPFNAYVGAVYVELGDVTISNSEFVNNSGNEGGALYTTGSLNISDSIFDANQATIFDSNEGVGGAISYYAISNASLVNIQNTVFTNNIAERIGSALNMYALDQNENSYSALLTLDSVQVHNNTSDYSTIADLAQ